ncbi:MAG: hypothetical protein NTZ16_14905 [Verrucomicrobia bacterium]|nr:hypothetical protein [Verrucomicrobiota bacterium]
MTFLMNRENIRLQNSLKMADIQAGRQKLKAEIRKAESRNAFPQIAPICADYISTFQFSAFCFLFGFPISVFRFPCMFPVGSFGNALICHKHGAFCHRSDLCFSVRKGFTSKNERGNHERNGRSPRRNELPAIRFARRSAVLHGLFANRQELFQLSAFLDRREVWRSFSNS